MLLDRRLAPPPALGRLLEDLGLDPSRAYLTLNPAAEGYSVLPSPRRPQLLVPTGRGGTTMLRERHSRRRAVATARRVVAAVLAGRLRSGWAAPWPRLVIEDTSFSDLLALLDTRSGGSGSLPGVMLGPPRANRKPVFRVFGADGDSVAFAKLGINPLTDELVHQEASALRQVSTLALRRIAVPPVLHDGEWQGHRLLVTGALTNSGGPRQTRELPIEATRELSARLTENVPLARLPLMSLESESGHDVLDRARESLRVTHGDVLVGTCASHGDWSPWNMAWAGDVLQVWDWERFEGGVPCGFDAVHFAAASVRVGAEGAQGEGEFPSAARSALLATGVDAEQVDLLLVCYLLRIGLRYRDDLAREFTPGVQRRLEWVEATLVRELGELTG